MKKLSLSLLLTLSMAASAKVYYADPASTNKSAQGTSWEQAVTITNLQKAMNRFPAGDTVYVKGGTIRLSAITDRWEIKSGITLIGGFNPAATGTVSALPDYPSPTPTILSGDINNDGKPSSGDAFSLIRVDLQNNNKQTVTIQGFDLINTYYDNEEEGTDDSKTYLADAAALRIICGTAYVKNCHMYNHITPMNRGSQCVTVVGAQVHLIDCDLHDCISLSRGALLRLRNYLIGGVESNPQLSSVVVERCSFYNSNNMGSTDSINVEGVYGGAVHVSNGEFFAINSSFINNTTYSKGGAIRTASGLTLISCTLGNNYSARSDHESAERANSYGSALGLDSDSEFRLMNTIVVDDKDNGTKKYTPFYTDDNTRTVDDLGTSGGYNIMGTIFFVKDQMKVTDLSAFWHATDVGSDQGTIQNFFPYFGTISNLKDNGGCCYSILPQKMLNGPTVADLQAKADKWCPDWTTVDASVDQRGFLRDPSVTCIGAAALEAENPLGIEEIQSTFTNQSSAVFNLLGQPVDASYKGIVIVKGKKYLLQ